MGVKACNRKGCDHIMCDNYSSDYGYICHSCFTELHDSCEMFHSIKEFMDTPKKSTSEFLADDSRSERQTKIFNAFIN